MPILLHCDELEPGMRLAEPIVHHGRTMLTGGKTITHADVDILRRKYPDLCVRISDPILDNIVEFEDDSHDRNVASTAQRKIVAAMSDVNERFSSRASLPAVNVRALQDTVSDVMNYLQDNPVSAALLSRTLADENYLTEHAGNVFYLSMILGCAVRDYVNTERQRQTACRWVDLKVTMDLLPLGLGAMLCDLGMVPLQHLYTSKAPLTDEDRQSIREHPEAGADMLPTEMSATTRVIVRTHHENMDGTGYPSGQKGDQIHIFSRIVRIADAYDAATALHVYKEAKSPARALWEMSIGPYRRTYDPVLMKVFTRLIQPFPVGAKLRLRDGRFAVVVRYNRQNPFLPTVIVALDPNGDRLPNSRLEGPLCLAERADLRIQAFADEQLSYLFSTAPSDDDAVNRGDFSTLFEAVFP